MGWLKRLFGLEHQDTSPTPPAGGGGGGGATAEAIAPERVGLNGEFDQSGLAKRVAAAFDRDPQIAAIETVWVAQTGGTVVLKGKVKSPIVLHRMEEIAHRVSGAASVDSSQVTIEEQA